jgi:hypothetical protein
LKGAQEVKDHIWFKNFPWRDLYEKKTVPKFVPKLGDNFDAKYCQAPDKFGENTKENYELIIQRETIQDFFRKFTFIQQDEERKQQSVNVSYKTSKKFINPHTSLSSSVELTTRVTNKQTTDKGTLPSIYPNKLFKSKLANSQSTPNIVIKSMKKSSSAINYNYIRNKPVTGMASYFFQN